MRVVLALLLLIAAAGSLGYFGRDLISPKDTKLPFPDRSYSPSDLDLGCDVVTASSAYENRFDSTANAHAGMETDKVALSLSSDGKTVSVLYAQDVANGATQAFSLEVHLKTASYIVAAGHRLLGDTSLILLHHKNWRMCLAIGAAQHGHRGSLLTRAAISRRRTVAIEFGMCRSGRRGGAPGSVTVG